MSETYVDVSAMSHDILRSQKVLKTYTKRLLDILKISMRLSL